KQIVYFKKKKIKNKKGDFLATGGLDNTCSVWNVRKSVLRNGVQPKDTYRPVAELTGHDGYIPRLEFVDDSQIVTCSGDSTIIYWDITKQKPMCQLLEHQSDVCSISLSSSATGATDSSSSFAAGHRNILLSGSVDKRCKIWDSRDNKSVHTYCGNSDFNVVSWLPIAHTFVTGSDDGIVRLYDTRVHSVVNLFDPHNYPFSLQNYISIDDDNKEDTYNWVICWIIFYIYIYTYIYVYMYIFLFVFFVLFCSNTHIDKARPLYSSTDTNLTDNHHTHRMTPMNGGSFSKNNASRYEVKDLSVSKTGAFICVGYKNQKQCILWNTLSGKQQSEKLTHPDRFGSISLAHDGKQFATTCYDNDIRLWAPHSPK
ncbi:hypothetical protein RFI_25469, partial [Reticulomyxa filosa]